MPTTNSNTNTKCVSKAAQQNCRRRLQTTFENSTCESKTNDRSVLSVLSFNDSTRKALRSGAERLTKTFNSVRTSIGTFSQKFRISTKRRQILEEGPMTPSCTTPHTFSRQVLGRTPTKMYSPFGIETPHHTNLRNKENHAP